MTIDDHNACPVCADPVLELYARVMETLSVAQRLADNVPRPLDSALIELATAAALISPYVEAHFANQDHALSPELAVARHPSSPHALELSRVLPLEG